MHRLRSLRLTLLSCLFLFWSLLHHVQAQHPSKPQLLALSQECRSLLESSVLDFYLPCLDQQQGGYLENLGADGKFTSGGGKFLTLQARHLWMFSTLAEKGIQREACLAAAKHGYEFLRTKFRDTKNGGYFNQLNDDGSIRDARKHVYLHSFALYGLIAYHRASGDAAPLQDAMDLFRLLEEKARDREHGGYQEFFETDWTLITDRSVPRMVGAVETKTYNTHLHLLESFAELYRVNRDPLVGQRLAELLIINTSTVQHPDYRCNMDGWWADWSLVDEADNLRASYGHDVECVWLTLDAARTLELPEQPLLKWANSLVAYSLKHGYDTEHGGFFYTGAVGQPASDLRKEWWVQAEALVCLLDMYRLTHNPEYMQRFQETFEFIKKHQIAKEGGWWATRQADGSASQNLSRTSMWQCGYHSGRGLLKSAEILEQLAQ